MIIHMKNLRLRTIIGMYEWERKTLQDVIINLHLEFDGSRVVRSDAVEDTVDYKALKLEIMDMVERSEFRMIETLASRILEKVMEISDILEARVEVDKPGALRFADSVSVECRGVRKDGTWVMK